MMGKPGLKPPLPDAISIDLGGGKYTLVDAVDAAFVSGVRWYAIRVADGCYYAGRSISDGGRKRKVYLHRVLMADQLGGDLQVDHINRDTLDNRRSNLRICTRTQNAQNSKARSDKSIPYKGVGRNKKRFSATIKVNKRRIHIGTFDTPEAARDAYNAAAAKYFGEFARYE